MTDATEARAREAVTLADCPIGLFWCGDTLALKTEYGNNEGRIDAYIVSSGEFFWGDSPQTIASQRAQLVAPIGTDHATSALLAPKQITREEVALPSLPRAFVTYADHSYPAYSAQQMRDYATAVITSLGLTLSDTESKHGN